jgi:hypothetical protein
MYLDNASCRTCLFSEEVKAWFECRYNPPVVVQLKQEDRDSLFPVVRPDDWCGKYARGAKRAEE